MLGGEGATLAGGLAAWQHQGWGGSPCSPQVNLAPHYVDRGGGAGGADKVESADPAPTGGAAQLALGPAALGGGDTLGMDSLASFSFLVS